MPIVWFVALAKLTKTMAIWYFTIVGFQKVDQNFEFKE